MVSSGLIYNPFFKIKSVSKPYATKDRSEKVINFEILKYEQITKKSSSCLLNAFIYLETCLIHCDFASGSVKYYCGVNYVFKNLSRDSY